MFMKCVVPDFLKHFISLYKLICQIFKEKPTISFIPSDFVGCICQIQSTIEARIRVFPPTYRLSAWHDTNGETKSFTKIYKLYCSSTNSNNAHKHRHNSPSFSCCVRFGCLWFICASEYIWRRNIQFLSHKAGSASSYFFFFFKQTQRSSQSPVVFEQIIFAQTSSIRNIFRSHVSLNIKIYEALKESICLYFTARKCSVILVNLLRVALASFVI